MNGQKAGGNVASYFTLPDGRVLHALAGPVDAATLLREARWVVETRKMALAEARDDSARYKAFFRKAHADRLQAEHGLDLNSKPRGKNLSGALAISGTYDRLDRHLRGNPGGRVHLLLATYPLSKIEQIYGVIFEKILGQKITTLPVKEN